MIIATHWDDFESPLEEPACDTGTLEAFLEEARRRSRRSRLVVPEHLETLEP